MDRKIRLMYTFNLRSNTAEVLMEEDTIALRCGQHRRQPITQRRSYYLWTEDSQSWTAYLNMHHFWGYTARCTLHKTNLPPSLNFSNHAAGFNFITALDILQLKIYLAEWSLMSTSNSSYSSSRRPNFSQKNREISTSSNMQILSHSV
jgi:hypothetical protein